jgi:uncharacterized membrane protein YozB (DUF420 family)
MDCLIKIVAIFAVATISLLIGGWIAVRIRDMDDHINLIDW